MSNSVYLEEQNYLFPVSIDFQVLPTDAVSKTFDLFLVGGHIALSSE